MRKFLKAAWEGIEWALVVCIIFFCMNHIIKSIRSLEDSVRNLDDSDYYQEQYFTLKDSLHSNYTASVIQTALYKVREKEIEKLRNENKLLRAVLNGKYKISLTYDDVKHIVIPPFVNKDGWYSAGPTPTIEDIVNKYHKVIRAEYEKESE